MFADGEDGLGCRSFPEVQSRSSIHLWLATGVLLVSWLLVVVATGAVGASCGSDCGDNGGRGAFIGLVAATPLGTLGLTLAGLGARGRLRPIVRLLSRAALVGGALLAFVALVVAVHAADQLLDALTGSDLHAIGQEQYERSQMKKDAAGSGVVAVALLVLAASALLPTLAGRSGVRSRAWARRLVVALTAIYLLIVVDAVANIDARVVPYALLGLITIAGAALVFAELRRAPY
jgi:hypothetical protein